MLKIFTKIRTTSQLYSLYIIRHRVILSIILYLSILTALIILFINSSGLFLLVPLYIVSSIYFTICDKFNLRKVKIVNNAFIFLCKLSFFLKSSKNYTR